jgi:non-specific serine/threonine protein kinase
VRFEMLGIIREYGLEQLRLSGEQEQVEGGLVRSMLLLVGELERHWFGPQAKECVARLQSEHANYRTALNLCLSGAGTADTALRLAGPYAYWAAFSLSEGLHWLGRALEGTSGDLRTRARALVSYGYLASLQGDQAEARASLDEAAGCAQEDLEYLGLATHLRGLSWFFDGDLERAVSLMTAAAELYRTSDAEVGLVAMLHVHTGLALIFVGDLDGAECHFRSALELSRRGGDRWTASYALVGLAVVEHDRGRDEVARRLLRESLETGRDVRDILGNSLGLDVLAWVLAADGEAERAAVVLAGAARLWKTFGRVLYGSKEWMRRRTASEIRLRTLLGDKAFEAASALGSALGREELLSFALDDESGARATSARPRTSEGLLTRREMQIARLVARGMANREIARELTLSIRTVEGHVQQVLTKLAFTSRVQIAAWLVNAERAPVE